MLKKSNVVFFVLIFFTQIWTIKIGPLSVAMFGFVLASLVRLKLFSIPVVAYAVLVGFVASVFFVWPEQYDSTLYYSKIFPLISIAIQLLFVNILGAYKGAVLPRCTHVYIYLNLLFALASAAILTPENFISASDGFVAFFNEKGLYGHYLSLLVILLVVHRDSRFNYLLFCLVSAYVFFVIQAGRSLLLYLAFFFILVQIGSLKVKIYTIAGLCCILPLVVFGDFGNMLLVKLSILGSGDGMIGRYAAMSIVLNSSTRDLLWGHGYGTYLNYRAVNMDLPGGAEYDYAGSLILQFLVEIGLPATIIVLALLVKYIFGRITVLLFCALLCLVAIGGAHDIQMLTTIVLVKLAYQTILVRGNKNLPLVLPDKV